MSDERPVLPDELHAAADGQLPAERRAAVEAHLAAQPEDAARVGFYQRLNAELHALFDPMLAEAVPDSLARRRHRALAQWLRAAAAVALLVGGGALGWLARDLVEASPTAPAAAFTRLAADAHNAYVAEVRHPVEVPASDQDHLVKWLSKRLDEPVRVPTLTRVGYEFMGGRLLPADGGVAAQLMYQNTAGSRVTLYFKRGGNDHDTAFRYVVEDGVSVFHWRDGEVAYALSSELPRETLLAVCDEVYAQLNPGNGGSGW